MGNFTIIHVNIRGLRANRDNLIRYLEENSFPEVVTLNETKINQEHTIEIPNYNCVAQKGGVPHGSMILKRKDVLDVSIIQEFSQTNEEVVGIRLNGGPNRPTINIITIYNRPGNHVSPTILDRCHSLTGRTLITGDFNCKHVAWGSTRNDPQGVALLQMLNDRRLVILNDGTRTRCDPISGNDQALDLCITNSIMAQNFRGWYVDGDIGSDHYPLRTTFQLGSAPSSATTYRNIKDTDWEKFKNYLTPLNTLPLTNALEVDNAVAALTQDIRQAFLESCPEKVNRFRNTQPFSKEMLQMVKEKRRLRREKANMRISGNTEAISLLQRQINKINNDLKKLQKVRHKEKLMSQCKQLNSEKDSKQFFNLFNKIQGKNHQSASSSIIEDGDESATTDQEKADLFARRLSHLHRTREDKHFSNEWKTKVEAHINEHKHIFEINKDSSYSNPEPGDDSLYLSDITAEEIKETLKRCKNKSAPGEDKISYCMLKRLPKAAVEYLAKIFNAIQKLGYFPQAWKTATIKMVPKPGKDKKEAKNWRPISLLSCLGKLFERIATSRLTSYLEANKLLSPFQSGFRKGRMTTEQLFRLAEDSYSSLKVKGYTAALFLDAEAAFDQAWHDGIRYKVKELKVPQRLIRLISSFLSGRHLTVNVGDKSSNKVTMEAGTPQGSCLSPLLYIILVNDTPPIENNSSIGQFADDIALWANAYTQQGCMYRLQLAINQLESWCRRWRIKLNGAKSQLLIISRLPINPAEEAAVQLFDDIVRPTVSAKYLGVQIDNRLKFAEHMQEIEKKAVTRLNIFKMLSKNGVDAQTMIRLYKTYVRPLFEYGSITFLPSQEIKQLQRIQNEFIRLSLRIPRYLRTDLIHEAAGLELVEKRICTVNCRLIKKMASNDVIKATINKAATICPLNNHQSPLDVLKQSPEYNVDCN